MLLGQGVNCALLTEEIGFANVSAILTTTIDSVFSTLISTSSEKEIVLVEICQK
jgi:hypothetical protein